MHTILFLAFLCLTLPYDATAQMAVEHGEQDEVELSALLEEYLQEAAERNPDLQARFSAYRSQLQQLPQVGALPDPEIMLGFHTNPPEAVPLPGRFMFSAQQRLPWPGTLNSRQNEQQHRAEAAYLRFEQARLDLFRDVVEAWARYAEMERAAALMQENLDLIDGLMPMVETRYETARARQADVLRLRMERSEVQTQLESLHDEGEAARVRFNEITGRDADAPVRVPDVLPDAPLPAALEADARALLSERHPGLQAFDALQEAEEAAERTARLEGLPDFGLGIEVMGRDYGMMRMMDGGEAIFGMVSIRIPLQRGRFQARQEEARLDRETAALQQEQLHHELQAELMEHLSDYRTAARRAALYQDDLIPQARQTLDILESDYIGGQAGFDEVIAMQQQLLQYSTRLAEARATRLIALAELEARTGTHLALRPAYVREADHQLSSPSLPDSPNP